MPLLAESIDGALPIIFGIPLVLIAAGLLSFWPATRGHWSALVLAAPCLLIGFFLTASIVLDSRKDMLMPSLWIFFPAPLLIGIASVALWFVRRRSRGGRA